MRVLDTATGECVEIDPRNSSIKYAILSHTWDTKGEQTYQELRDIQKRYTAERQPPESLPRDSQTPPPSSTKHRRRRWSPTITLSRRSHSPSSAPPATPQSLPLHDTASGRLLNPIWADPDLSPKIREACRVAREKGYHYLWIDSCCIDKTSSSELSESINSMYQWYALADVCYVFLATVPVEADHERKKSHFRRSRWFRRGWTLQELIAPVDVVFLSRDWRFIGSKESLAELVVKITSIAYNALLHVEPLDEFSVAQRLSWASNRETTRMEDRAYSLLGLFNINMPTLYGEGEGAFRRLQEEIMRRTPDQSLFAWMFYGLPDPSFQHQDPDTINANNCVVSFRRDNSVRPNSESLLARSLDSFRKCTGIEMLSHDEVIRRLQLPTDSYLPATDYDFTPYGLRVQLPVISLSSSNRYHSPPLRMHLPGFSQWYLVILGCGHKDFPGHLLGRVCYTTRSSASSIEFLYSGFLNVGFPHDLHPLSPATITRLHSSQISMKTLYIPQPQRDEAAKDIVYRKPHETIKLVLSKKTHDTLSARGYTVTPIRSLDRVHPATHSVTLSRDTHTITIDYQHTLDKTHWSGQSLTIEAHVKTSGPILQEDTPGNLRVPQVDGLGTGVSWNDYIPWSAMPSFRDVRLNIGPGPMLLTVTLGLTFITTNHYLLDIELAGAGWSEDDTSIWQQELWGRIRGPMPGRGGGRLTRGGGERRPGGGESGGLELFPATLLTPVPMATVSARSLV